MQCFHYSCHRAIAECKFDYNLARTDNDMQIDRVSVQSGFSKHLQIVVMVKKRGGEDDLFWEFVCLFVS